MMLKTCNKRNFIEELIDAVIVTKIGQCKVECDVSSSIAPSPSGQILSFSSFNKTVNPTVNPIVEGEPVSCESEGRSNKRKLVESCDDEDMDGMLVKKLRKEEVVENFADHSIDNDRDSSPSATAPNNEWDEDNNCLDDNSCLDCGHICDSLEALENHYHEDHHNGTDYKVCALEF